MEVILRQDVQNLGKRGDVVRVKGGYARNFLIPKQMAMKVTRGARRQVEIERAAHERKLGRMRGQHEDLAGRIESLSFTVAGKASDAGKLYGSVRENEVVKLLATQDIEISRNQVILEDHIKQVGVYHIPIRFQHDLVAQVKIWVVAEGDERGVGLPEDVPDPQLFIGGRQSVDEALAHAPEILAEQTEEEGESDETNETADTEEESAGAGDKAVDAVEETDAEGGEEPEEEPSP